MIRLCYSNQLERLIEPLAENLDRAQRERPLAPIDIVVPNRAIEQFIKYRVAEQLGVAANLRFPFLRGYLADLVARATNRVRVLEAPDLARVLYECLSVEEYRNSPELADAREYVGTEGAAAEVRRCELAEHLAHLFQEYSLSRAGMLDAWRQRRAELADIPFAGAESWQRYLWQAAFDRDGAVRSRWMVDPNTRWMLLPDAIAAVSDQDLRRALPPDLHVFAVESPAQVFSEIFSRLSGLTRVSVYALNPCAEFWEDLDAGSRARAAGWANRDVHLDRVAIEASDDPYGLKAYDSSDPLALRMWGRPGREYIRRLNDLAQCDFASRFENPVGGTLLARLKRDVLERREHNGGAPSANSSETPASIRIMGCAGIRREVEAIASEVAQLMCDSERGASPLRFHEVGILIPDSSAELYRTHLETVFERIGLPIENGAGSEPSRVIEAIRLLLDLPLGRLTRGEILRLLRHPAISGPERDTDRFEQWCAQAGVIFGADASDFAETYLEGASRFHWDQALTRIALGGFLHDDSGEQMFLAASGEEQLPVELREDDLETAAWMLRTARALLFDARAIQRRNLTLSEWSRLLRALVEHYVQPAESYEQRTRDRALEAIARLAESPVSSEPVPYAVAHRIASSLVAERASRRGSFAGHGVAAGPLSRLHSLPFRVVFIAGLGEAVFPEREAHDALDLRRGRRRAGDVSAAERDRYQFLEALLGARERVLLSYVQRDSQTGDPLEPSTVIRELEFVLRKYLDDAAVKRLVSTQPVSRYDPRYLSPEPDRAVDDGRVRNASDSNQLSLFAGRAKAANAASASLPCYDRNALSGARIAALRNDLEGTAAPLPARDELQSELERNRDARVPAALELIELPESVRRYDPGEILIPLSALRRYLECPIQGAARFALGMREEEERDEEVSDEPIAQNQLDHTTLMREAFWRAAHEPFAQTYADAFARKQMEGHAPAGEFSEAQQRGDLAQYKQWCEQSARVESGQLSRWREISLGHSEEHPHETLRSAPYVELEVPIRAAHRELLTQRVKIFGRIGRFAPDLSAGIQCVLRNKSKAHDFLHMFLGAIALVAAGEPVPSNFRAVVLGRAGDKGDQPPWERALKTPSQSDARAYLTDLVSDLLSDKNHYFVPIEAVEDVVNDKKNRDPVDLVDDVRERPPPATCRSNYGPVRNARTFELPTKKQIEAIIERRYSMIRAIFD